MYLYIGFLFMLSLSIALMPIGVLNKEYTMFIVYLTGLAFWCGMIGTFFMAYKMNYCRKSSCGIKKQTFNPKNLGVLHFFKNKEATIIDIGMFISIVIFIIVKIFISEIFLSFVFLAFFVFTFGMHCMLNGINYEYIKPKLRRD